MIYEYVLWGPPVGVTASPIFAPISACESDDFGPTSYLPSITHALFAICCLLSAGLQSGGPRQELLQDIRCGREPRQVPSGVHQPQRPARGSHRPEPHRRADHVSDGAAMSVCHLPYGLSYSLCVCVCAAGAWTTPST